jgi:uncharacterized protein YejL (UPF0352 family)
MALNPFFLQGSYGEQRLVQELINEQLKIYGVEVTYIPRKFVRKQTIIEEIQSSTFDDNFLLEAYINNFDGYGGAGDIMTKFGVSIRDELSLTISKERFEDFIAVFLEDMDDGEIEVATRPREGDLIYFPLGQRIFEVKFVEHEQPFYQLGKNYVYELKCELFEYEDEVIDTTIDEISDVLEKTGYIIDLSLFSGGTTANVSATVNSGYIRQIFLNNDGSGYTSTPTVAISTAPSGGTNATAVAITTTRNNITSIKEILLTNAGAGYTVTPTISISGGGGSGAAATCSINTASNGLISFNVTGGGAGYSTTPSVTVSAPGSGTTAIGRAVVSDTGTISRIYVINPGDGYTSTPSVVVGAAATTGIGTFWRNEIVTGSRSGTTARVKRWVKATNTLQVGISSGTFYPGELITGSKSGAEYQINVSIANTTIDKYSQNDQFEVEADNILDFTESNPFGNY